MCRGDAGGPGIMNEPLAPPGSPEFRITPQLVVGLLIIFVGLILTLDQLGVAHALTYLKFWPVALIMIGIVKVSYARTDGGVFAGLVFMLVGGWLQAEELGLISISLREAWPIALVLFGGYLVWQGLTKRPPRVNPEPSPIEASAPPFTMSSGAEGWNPPAPSSPQTDPQPSNPRITDTNSSMSAMAILGGVSRGNNSRAFRRADLLAIMGGCEIDLRQAAINGEAVIDVFAMWGGIEIRVPENWTVVSRVVPLMGGIVDKTRPPQGASAHRLVLRGCAFMGGIEIKN
jgi:LiaF transmembrane domain